MDQTDWNDWWWGVNQSLNFNNLSPEEWSKRVGTESRKTWMEKYKSGFWRKYCPMFGLEIGNEGYTGEKILPIVPTALSINMGYPGYDGKTLPFANNSQGFVYSSHVLEHIDYRVTTIKEWFRVLDKNGYLIIVVPHCDLYEKKEDLPSRWNEDHKVFYRSNILLNEIDRALGYPNAYRIRHLQENDKGHNYNQRIDEHSVGEYEIEVVLQKL